jgi:hypothetical protein
MRLAGRARTQPRRLLMENDTLMSQQLSSSMAGIRRVGNEDPGYAFEGQLSTVRLADFSLEDRSAEGENKAVLPRPASRRYDPGATRAHSTPARKKTKGWNLPTKRQHLRMPAGLADSNADGREKDSHPARTERAAESSGIKPGRLPNGNTVESLRAEVMARTVQLRFMPDQG